MVPGREGASDLTVNRVVWVTRGGLGIADGRRLVASRAETMALVVYEPSRIRGGERNSVALAEGGNRAGEENPGGFSDEARRRR